MILRWAIERPRGFARGALTIIITAGLSSPLWGAPTAPNDAPARPNMRVILTSRDREVSLGDDVSLLVLLRNDSIYPLKIFGQVGFGVSAGLVLEIVDETGAQIQSPMHLDAQVRPPKRGDPHSCVRLEGGLSLGVDLTGPAKDLFPTRGRYRLRVRYRSPVSQDDLGPECGGAATVWRESGVWESEEVVITVK